MGDFSLRTNTTGHLIAETLRELHRVERWTVLGMSWGTTLGLAYAQAHTRRVHPLVLALVTTTSRREVEWITHDVGRIFPREWNRFATAVPDALLKVRLLALSGVYVAVSVSLPAASAPDGMVKATLPCANASVGDV